MHILFKYCGLMPVEYFEKPTVKLSVPEHLNDPFEYNTSENIVAAIKRNILKLGATEEDANSISQTYLNSVHTIISQNGIVSLTETPRNFLMWAHYATQHNGMCIGFKKNFLEHINNNIFYDENTDITIKTPVKVNYDNLRFSSEQEYEDVESFYKYAVIQHLLTKSDEWMYEKEHRAIIPYKSTTKIMIHDRNFIIRQVKAVDRQKVCSSPDTTVGDWVDFFVSLGHMSKTDHENIYQINNGYIDEKPELMGAIQILTNSPQVSFLVNTDKEMVDSIYFGCRVDKEVIKKYFDNFGESIKIFHMEVCKVRFELTPIRVTQEYFN